MADKKPTIGDVLDKLGITFSDWRTIKSDIEFSMRNREIVLCGGDWEGRKCGECGYMLKNVSEHNPHKCDVMPSEQACPDFVPREVPE